MPCCPGIFFGSLCPCPSQVSFFFLLLFPLTYTCSCFQGPVCPSFVVPILYATSPPLLMHLRQPPSPSPDLCVLRTWPCQGPTTMPVCPVSPFFVFVLPSLTHLQVHSLSSSPVLRPLTCRTPCQHPLPLPPCQCSWHPVQCITAFGPGFCSSCQCPGPPFLL